jgi:hypothetical protein
MRRAEQFAVRGPIAVSGGGQPARQPDTVRAWDELYRYAT